jgi:hypothetical protein
LRIDGYPLEGKAQCRIDEQDIGAKGTVDSIPGIMTRIDRQNLHPVLFRLWKDMPDITGTATTTMQPHQ